MKKKLIFSTLIISLGILSLFSFSTHKEGSVTDIDGNIYHTTTIGDQTWMVENLKVSRYNNGDSILTIPDRDDWYRLEKGATCVYRNLNSFVNDYGRLYNWYALKDKRGICPKGWHVATDADWKELEKHLGGNVTAGSIKSLKFWDPPNGGAANTGSLAILPGGLRNYYGDFNGMGTFGHYWTSTETPIGTAIFRRFTCYNTKIQRDEALKQSGFSVRCVKD